ncbi:hypothetical protein P171DRAFT_485587 [Karstenula rhodostoma CBS 690.94]|uniref:Uncharacterized protein n=1 Tax=Karstenula rhodostoma CBS 690.94 TaxID=1392251 RepID=A0A9P4PHK2_9PLEO|nr:hypothetical protein P171DRAFT_485587 [Karstenula rhodostoma CBS 690.94]
MLRLKLFVVVAAVFGAAVAVVAAVPADNFCYTAPAVTITVTVTECGHPTKPAAPPSESQAHSMAPPPVATSWLPSSPAPVPAPAPVPSSPALSAPAPPASSGPAPGSSESVPPASPASSGSPSGSEPSSPEPAPTATDKPISSSSDPGNTPTSSSKPEQPPSSAASLSGVSLGMGSIVVVGMAINAAVAAFV